MTEHDKTQADAIRDGVRRHYAVVAAGSEAPAPAPPCCAPDTAAAPAAASDSPSAGCSPSPAASSSCCGGGAGGSDRLGYSGAELASVPSGADLGLGCGNPQAIAALRPGETVLDLGSGGGLDCFLAARRVGPSGKVIGVDMTPEMVSRARESARRAGVTGVEFRLGEIEHLPVADASVDVVLSNCVINLSPDQAQVYREAWRVLRPGGRLAIADVVQTAPLPEALRRDAAARSRCIAGAAAPARIEAWLRAAGFREIRIRVHPESRDYVKDWFPGAGAENCVASATIEARK